jgi:DNA-binding CsgD family transcriptional regulator
MAFLSLVPKTPPPEPTPEPSRSVQADASPGILVVAPPLQLLHMNQRAMGLMNAHLAEEGPGSSLPKVATGVLPAPILKLCKDIFRLFEDCGTEKDWGSFEVRRVIGSPPRQLVLRGFGVPDPRGGKHARLVILIEPGNRPQEGLSPEATRQFRFTPREEAVIQSLSKGLTNKEIGAALGISLPTVKEHIRHIMEKTHSSTRTSVLVRLFKPE